MGRNPERAPLRRVEFLVLAVLSDGKLHGYGIAQELKERTGGKMRVRPGDLYRVLHRLSDRGFVEAVDRSSAVSGSEERRTYYGLTRLGRRTLRAEADLLSAFLTRLERSPAARSPS